MKNKEKTKEELLKELKALQENYSELKKVNNNLLEKVEKQKPSEEELRKNEARYRDLVNLLPQPVYEIDRNGKFTFINESGLKTIRYTREDLENGIYFHEIFIPLKKWK